MPSNPTLQFATAILKRIQEKQLDAETLTTEQRRMCVRYLVHERTLTKIEMAELLKISRSTLYDDIKALDQNENMASLMINEIEQIQNLMMTAEIAIAKLFRKGKEKDAFEVQDKFIDRLQSLGYVKRVAQEHQFTGKVSLLEVLQFEQTLPHPPGNGSNGNGRDHASGSRLEDASR